MVEDKYIGLSLAVSSSLAIGTSFILTKKVGSLCYISLALQGLKRGACEQGLNQAGEQSAYSTATDSYGYIRNPMWWAGMSTCE